MAESKTARKSTQTLREERDRDRSKTATGIHGTRNEPR